MEVKSRSFLRDSIGIFNTNIFLTLINISIGILVARSLGVYNTGIYYSLLVIPNLIAKVGTLGLGPSLIFHIGKAKFPLATIIKSLYYILFISAILSILALFVIYYYLDNPEYSYLYIIILAVFLPLQFIRMINNRILLATKQIKKSNYLRAIPRTINLICLLFFFFINRLGILEALLSLLVSSIIINIIYFFIITKSFELTKHKISKKSIQSLVKYGALFTITSLVMRFNYEFDIVLLERLSSFNEVGIYKMGVNFTQLLQQIPMAITPLLMVRAAHSKNINKNLNTTLSFFRISILISIIAGLCLFFLAEILIPFFYGADFLPSAKIVHIILPGILFLIAFSTLSSQTAGSGKPLFAFYSFLPALVINIVLNIIWIPKYGGAGAAWASNISYFTGLGVFLIIFVRHYNISFLSLFRFSIKDFYALTSKDK